MSKATNTKLRTRQVFVSGVLRGLAAPGMLFAPSTSTVALELDVSKAPVVETPDELRHRSDWGRIGLAIKTSATAHGQ